MTTDFILLFLSFGGGGGGGRGGEGRGRKLTFGEGWEQEAGSTDLVVHPRQSTCRHLIVTDVLYEVCRTVQVSG